MQFIPNDFTGSISPMVYDLYKQITNFVVRTRYDYDWSIDIKVKPF